MKGIKVMSPYMVDELVLLGHHLLMVKKGEENNEKTETLHQERERKV